MPTRKTALIEAWSRRSYTSRGPPMHPVNGHFRLPRAIFAAIQTDNTIAPATLTASTMLIGSIGNWTGGIFGGSLVIHPVYKSCCRTPRDSRTRYGGRCRDALSGTAHPSIQTDSRHECLETIADPLRLRARSAVHAHRISRAVESSCHGTILTSLRICSASPP